MKIQIPARRSCVRFLAGLFSIAGAFAAPLSPTRADAPAPTSAIPEKTFDAPNGLKISIKMIGPITQSTDLQIICILKHEPAPAGDKYEEAFADLNKKLGGLLSSLRERGEFAGDAGETLLVTPPTNSIAPARLLLIGVGSESALSQETFSLVGRVAARESTRLGVSHVSFAPMLRDQGSTRVDVGEGDAAVVEQLILAYDTELRLQNQGLSAKGVMVDFTLEAGRKFFGKASEKVGEAVVRASKEIEGRNRSPYAAPLIPRRTESR